MTREEVFTALREYTGRFSLDFDLVQDPSTEAWAARDRDGNHYVVHPGPQKPWEKVEEVRFSSWPPRSKTF